MRGTKSLGKSAPDNLSGDQRRAQTSSREELGENDDRSLERLARNACGVYSTSREGRAMPTVIPSLPGSHFHQANIELYQRHRQDGDGRCLACGYPAPCEVAKYT